MSSTGMGPGGGGLGKGQVGGGGLFVAEPSVWRGGSTGDDRRGPAWRGRSRTSPQWCPSCRFASGVGSIGFRLLGRGAYPGLHSCIIVFQAVQALHHGNPPFKKKADASDPSYRSPSLAGAQAIGEARFSGGYCMWTGPSRPRCSRARDLPGAIGASSRCRRSLPGPGERPRVAATPDWGHRKVCS